MSVLIKDMEMPETCDDCPFHVYHSHYEYVCKATPMFYPMNLANTKGIRKEWCPLIEQDLGVMLADCDFQERFYLYGDERIDKPGWLQWRAELLAEKMRRDADAEE